MRDGHNITREILTRYLLPHVNSCVERVYRVGHFTKNEKSTHTAHNSLFIIITDKTIS